MTKHHPLLVPPGTKLEPERMYARLFHGRTDPEQQMENWGFNGPVFGPLDGVSLTYLAHLRLHGEYGREETDVWAKDDMLKWDDSYYGDLYIFVAGEQDRCV